MCDQSSEDECFKSLFSSLEAADVFQETEEQEQSRIQATQFASVYTAGRPWGIVARSKTLYSHGTDVLQVHIRDKILCVMECMGQQAMVWDCALVLANFLDNNLYFNEDFFVGKDVIELGCGVGVPGMAAAALGAASVFLTDMAHAIPQINANIKRNIKLYSGQITACALEWGSVAASNLDKKFDVILCSDVVYGEEQIAKNLVDCIAQLSHKATVIISAHEERYAGDRGQSFFAELKRLNFHIEQVPFSHLDPVYQHPGISVNIINL